ncbi:hypothetical protein ACLOJK_005746 [Asimina triloba]
MKPTFLFLFIPTESKLSKVAAPAPAPAPIILAKEGTSDRKSTATRGRQWVEPGNWFANDDDYTFISALRLQRRHDDYGFRVPRHRLPGMADTAAAAAADDGSFEKMARQPQLKVRNLEGSCLGCSQGYLRLRSCWNTWVASSQDDCAAAAAPPESFAMRLLQRSCCLSAAFAQSRAPLINLLLQREYGGHTSIDRIVEPCLGLVRYGYNRIMAPVGRYVQQQLRHIAGTKHLVHRGEPGRALVRPEIGCENAPADALPPQELAGTARRRTYCRRRRLSLLRLCRRSLSPGCCSVRLAAVGGLGGSSTSTKCFVPGLVGSFVAMMGRAVSSVWESGNGRQGGVERVGIRKWVAGGVLKGEEEACTLVS